MSKTPADLMPFTKSGPIVDHVAEYMRDPEHGILTLMAERSALEMKVADLKYELTRLRYRYEPES